MAQIACLHAKSDVERFCRRNPFLHLYALGDLDDFFWPNTTWFALKEGDDIRQLALLYTDWAMRMPTLLALGDPPVQPLAELLHGVAPALPRRFHAHISPGAADALRPEYHIGTLGDFHKMGLTHPSRVDAVDAGSATQLVPSDTKGLLALYDVAYPGHWFVPRMLETGFYFGIRGDASILSVAGVHVYSQTYKVAALGNVATHPAARGQGLAAIVVARACQEHLRAGVKTIGLNVKADNLAAIACYRKLGFEPVADYREHTLSVRA